MEAERNRRPYIKDIINELEELEAEITEMSLSSYQSKYLIGQVRTFGYTWALFLYILSPEAYYFSKFQIRTSVFFLLGSLHQLLIIEHNEDI